MNSYGASVGREQRRRPGGYGGFSEESQLRPPPSQDGEQGGDRSDRADGLSHPSSRARPRDAETGTRWRPGRDGTNYITHGVSREGVNSVRGTQSIEDLLQAVERGWDFMASDDCVPVQVALQLMDSSTLGKADREVDFISTHKHIQRTLKSIVNDHHQGFNSSIGTYHKIQSSIHSSQNRVRALRNSLEDAKSRLLTTKPELKTLATTSQNYDDILQLFNEIQNLQVLPEKLEAQISEKRFLSAVDVLYDGFRSMRRYELDSIGALVDLRSYFNNQETSLTDILIEELHDQLYLKSPYSQDRWKTPTGEMRSGGNPASWAGASTWNRPVHSFLAKLDTLTPLTEDASRNPEANPFHYIQLILEALNKMGHLDAAVNRVEQRLPVELFAVVDKTSADVDARYRNLARGFSSQDSKSSLPIEIDEPRGRILSEFLWTLYAKFEAIAEGHRVVHDVITGIVKREGIRTNSLMGGFKELWKLYQSEIRSLLHDYLATDGDSSVRLAVSDSDGRQHNASGQRDKNRKMFKLTEIGQKSIEFKAEQDDLEEILRVSVPGLLTKSKQKSAVSDTSQSRQGNSGTGHKLLVKPSVFNMALLLPPSLTFLQRLKDIVPINSDIASATLTSFLDDFLITVFLPQLDDTVSDLCTLSLIALDAFVEDPNWASVSPRPVFKGAVSFVSLVKAFSRMLDSIPHDQAFTQLILNQIVTFYDKCCGWYKAIVTKASSQAPAGIHLKAAAAFTESNDISDTVRELWKYTGDGKQELIDKEITLLIKHSDDRPLDPNDLILDPKTVTSLSILYNSLNWLASHLVKLRHITTSSVDSSHSESRRTTHGRRWTLITSKPKRHSISQPVYLPMSEETVLIFDKTLQSLRNLAIKILLTLHIDIRCGIIHMLTKAMAGPNPLQNRDDTPSTPPPSTQISWHLIMTTPPTAASSTILELNNDLIAVDTSISTYLGTDERRFITSGLARFIDQTFISCTRFIGAMNQNGALRLQLDVLVLQQNLKNIIDPDSQTGQVDEMEQGKAPSREVVALPRSAKFLDWFLEGPEKALEYAKEEKETISNQSTRAALVVEIGEPFTYEELRVLVELCYSEIIRGPRGMQNREDFIAAKKNNGDALLSLSEVMWDSK